MNTNSIWSALEESFDLLGGYGYPAMDKAAAEAGLSPDYFTWVAAVSLFGEERFTTADFMRMFPYGQAQVNEAFFASAAQQGYLISDGNAAYRASELGLDTARKVFSAADDSIAHLHPLPDQPFQVLVNLLHRLAEASFAMPEPPAHFLLDRKRNMRRLPVTGLINRFERDVSELQGFRDDMFVASWGACQIQGHTWETFDQIIQSSPLTFDELFAKVKRRVPTRELLSKNIMELARRGWVDDASGKIHITSAGKQVRAEVEAETERLFFAPWACLSESELDELASLAGQLRDGLKKQEASMNLNSIWSDCKESYDLLNKVIYSVYRTMIEEKVVPKGFGGWGPFVGMFPDEAVTLEKYQRIFPYDAEQVFHESFSVAAQEGYLSFDGSGYRAADKGEEITQTVMQAFTDAVAPLQPMPQSELKRLVDYLIRLCGATDAAPEPPSHFCQTVYKNYKRTFPSDAPLTRWFVHYYKELDFYRTDAHAAAWQIHNIAGSCWEAFTAVWNGEADTLDKFYEEYSDRGFTRDEYAQAFQELVARGWIEENAGVFRVTAEGKRIRDEAEALTDKYFFAPWACLNESELDELANLASQLRDGLENN